MTVVTCDRTTVYTYKLTKPSLKMTDDTEKKLEQTYMYKTLCKKNDCEGIARIVIFTYDKNVLYFRLLIYDQKHINHPDCFTLIIH